MTMTKKRPHNLYTTCPRCHGKKITFWTIGEPHWTLFLRCKGCELRFEVFEREVYP